MHCTIAELIALSAEPSFADATSGMSPEGSDYIAVPVPDLMALSQIQRLELIDWLVEQSVPVVGVGLLDDAQQLSDSVPGEVIDALDLCVPDQPRLEEIATCIKRNPLASSVLVQVLRTVSQLPVNQALAVESLGYATLQGGAEFARWLADYQARRAGKTNSTASIDPETAVLLERSDEHLKIVLNTPQNRNALSVQMRDALSEAFKLVALDDSIRRVSVSGNGPCFSAGGDLTEFGSIRDMALAHHIRTLRMPAQYLQQRAAAYTCYLHSTCIGAGIEMPSFAGRLVAREDTTFQLPEVAMGLIPGAGGCVGITRRIGRQRTAWLAIHGQPIDAPTALRWGLIDQIEDTPS